MSAPAIDAARLLGRLDRFAAIGGTPAGGVNRQALTDGDRAARALLGGLATRRGFTVEQDAMANLFVRREGDDPALPPLLIGSHLDSQPSGGRYDGALGVLAALEVMEALEDAGVRTHRAVELVAWTNEEGSRYAPGAMGSQAFVEGALASGWLEQAALDGTLLADDLAATLAALPSAPLRPLGAMVSAYVELHIEQGPVLEREGIPIGIVTGIQGTRWLEVTIEGSAAHAGTTPLAFRRDPMVAAVSVLKALQDAVMPGDPDARLTVGRISALPGSVNAIAGSVSFTLDIRHPDPARLAGIEDLVRTLALEASAANGCRHAAARTLDMQPVRFDGPLIAEIEAAAARTGHASRRILSGAFHDALFLARKAPSAMIFVPCRDGLSHNEAEFAEPAHIAAGAEVMLDLVLSLAGRRAPGT